jgi:hypothetical protein
MYSQSRSRVSRANRALSAMYAIVVTAYIRVVRYRILTSMFTGSHEQQCSDAVTDASLYTCLTITVLSITYQYNRLEQ